MAISNRQFQWLNRRMGECYDRIQCSYAPDDYKHMFELLRQSKVLSNFKVVDVWEDGIEFKFVYGDEWVTGCFNDHGYWITISPKEHYCPRQGYMYLK